MYVMWVLKIGPCWVLGLVHGRPLCPKFNRVQQQSGMAEASETAGVKKEPWMDGMFSERQMCPLAAFFFFFF